MDSISLQRQAGNHSILSTSAMREALQLLFNRMDSIELQCRHGQFPLYSVGTSQQWVLSKGGSWSGGFWAGCWWLRALLNDSPTDEKKALEYSQRLNGKLNTDSINRSMIFWNACALGAKKSYSPYAKMLANTAANSLIKRYDAELACIPVGKAMGGGERGDKTLVIDTLSPLIQLCLYADNKSAERIAYKHLVTTVNTCLTESGAIHDSLFYNNQKFTHQKQAGTWARGQAWGVLGLAQAAACWGQPYTTYAIRALDYWENFLNNGLALNSLDFKTGGTQANLYDPSAMLIVSLASAILATLKPMGHFNDLSKQYLSGVVNSEYFYRDKNLSHKGNDQGIFWGANAPIGKQQHAMVESPWGLYLLMLSLAVNLRAITVDCI